MAGSINDCGVPSKVSAFWHHGCPCVPEGSCLIEHCVLPLSVGGDSVGGGLLYLAIGKATIEDTDAIPSLTLSVLPGHLGGRGSLSCHVTLLLETRAKLPAASMMAPLDPAPHLGLPRVMIQI